MLKSLKVLALVVPLLMLQACGFEIVDTGHRGIETAYGEVQGTGLPEGLHFYNPVTSNIVEMNVQERKWGSETTAYTQDVQEARLKFTVNYYPDPAHVHELFRDVGTAWANKLLPQVVEDSIKTVVGQWDAVALIANRDKARNEAFELIRNTLSSKHVIVKAFAINDLNYTDAFEQSVEAKQVAIQRAIEEQNRTVQIQEQANQKVLTAKAEAESIRIRSKALATNPVLVKWEAVKRWDGKLPVQMLGSAPLPFIEVGK